MLAEMPPPEQFQHLAGHLLYLARTGVVRHLDFCEPGTETAQMLREAAERTGVQSISFGRLERPPTSERELVAGDAPLSGAARSELGNLLNLVDGFASGTIDGLTGLACEEIKALTVDRHKRLALACPGPDFARLLELLDPQLVAPFAGAGPEEIAALAARRKTVALTPRATATLGLTPAPLAPLLQAGVPVLLGTGSTMLTSPNVWAELDFAWRLLCQQAAGENARDPRSILRMITANVRPVLGGDCHGYLERGLPADFAVLNFRRPHLGSTRNLVATLVSRVTPEEVLGTYRQGEPIWRAPEFNP
jgi:hypothetical protein